MLLYNIQWLGKKNDLPTKQLRISTTEQVILLLEKLVSTGMYGKNRTEAADRLLSEKLREIYREELPNERKNG